MMSPANLLEPLNGNKGMRIVTWNINSVRLRLPLLQLLNELFSPDIICLQETKVINALFPLVTLRELGFPFIIFDGQPSYNGTAILSRVPITLHSKLCLANSQDCRHLAVTLPDGTILHNAYVPAGGDIPDPQQNPKFAFKLAYVHALSRWFSKEVSSHTRSILVGDLNIAPLEHDVWSHKQLLSVVSHTPIEVEHLLSLQKSLDWVDVSRLFTPASEKLYSWWSYRNQDWKKSNRGRRLDHIWVTPSLKSLIQHSEIYAPARDWQTPSDHVPVIMDIALD